MRVCQRGLAGRPWARNPKTPHFYWLASPGPKPLTVINALGQPGPPTPHFYRRALGQPGPPKSLTFIDRARPAQPLTFIKGSAEEMPLPDGDFDTVVMTYSLCTIPDARAALNEIRRVLKPTGRLLFCEHGEAPDPSVAAWQTRINPLWRKLMGGCNLNRPIQKWIAESGFSIDSLEEMYLPGTPRIAGFNIWGSAS